MSYCKPLNMFRCVNPIRLDAISKTLSNEVCVKLSEFGLERQNDISPISCALYINSNQISTVY